MFGCGWRMNEFAWAAVLSSSTRDGRAISTTGSERNYISTTDDLRRALFCELIMVSLKQSHLAYHGRLKRSVMFVHADLTGVSYIRPILTLSTLRVHVLHPGAYDGK